MKSGAAAAIVALAFDFGATSVDAAEIRLAEQFSMGYLQFNVMKRDKLIEKYAGQRGLKDFKVSWQRFNGPAAMNEALLSGSTDIVAGGVPGLITLWDKTLGTSFEVREFARGARSRFCSTLAIPSIKSIKDFSDRDRIALPSIKVSVQAVVLQMAVAAAFGEENYAKLNPLTVSMSPPDSTIALLTGSGNITTVFSVPPFQFQQLAQSQHPHRVVLIRGAGAAHLYRGLDLGAVSQGQSRTLRRVRGRHEEATATVSANPRQTAQTWIDDTNSKLVGADGDENHDRPRRLPGP